MAKLNDTPETLEAIRAKALFNAKKLGTYNKRSSFKPGRPILTFSELCSQAPHRFLQH